MTRRQRTEARARHAARAVYDAEVKAAEADYKTAGEAAWAVRALRIDKARAEFNAKIGELK